MWQILAIISAVFSAMAAITEKKALFKMNALGFSLILSVFTFFLALPFAFWVDFAHVKGNAVLVLYLKSVLGALAFLLVMQGIKRNELSNSLPLLVFTPVVVAIAAFFLLNESIKPVEMAGMFLVLTGTYFLQLEKGGNLWSPFYFVKRSKSQWYIIGAIALFSATSILDKTLLKDYKLQPEAFLPLQQLFFSINFLLIALFWNRKQHILSRKQISENWLLILSIALFAIIYRYTHILAIKGGSVALVLSIKRTSVFFATIIGGSYFNEHNLIRRSIAVAIMVGGTAIVILT